VAPDFGAAFKVSVKDATKGELQVSFIADENDKPKLITMEFVLMKACSWVLFNVSSKEEKKEGGYFWGRVLLSDDTVILWFADRAQLRALALAGKLQARHDAKGDLLEPLSTADLGALTAGELGVPFDWVSPQIFRRMRPGLPLGVTFPKF
jgi:hypothetical protein